MADMAWAPEFPGAGAGALCWVLGAAGGLAAWGGFGDFDGVPWLGDGLAATSKSY